MDKHPSYDAEHLRQLDRQFHLHPFTDTAALNRTGTRIITRAEGVYLWDIEGHKILDAMAGLWCVNIGYGREELVAAAAQQMRELPYYNSFFQCTTPPAIELAELLASLTPDGLNHAFFTGSGSESNDTVVRMVRRYWQLKGFANKTVIISRKNAYHGSTVAAASLGGMAPMHAQGGLPIPDIEHIDQPYYYAADTSETPQQFGLRMAAQLQQAIERLGVDRVAAFIAEPIQGAGGVIIPPDSYWPEIQRICDHYGILLIADEVICGFGRTGEWFGSDYYQIRPDLISVAKGLSSGYQPIAAVMVGDRVADVLIHQCGEFTHGFTYSGHPVAAAVALENLKLLRDEGIVDQVRLQTGPYLQQRWRELAAHPMVAEVRGLGFLAALELVKQRRDPDKYGAPGAAGTVARDEAIANGVVMRAVLDTLVVSPPLIMTRTQIDELMEKVTACLDAVAARVL